MAYFTTGFSMSFTNDSYKVKVLAIEGIRGKELLKIEFNESKHLVKKFVTIDYSIHLASMLYFTIDSNGTIYIKQNLPNKNWQYYFQVTALYTVILFSGDTHTGFAHANVYVHGIGKEKLLLSVLSYEIFIINCIQLL